MKKAWIYAVSLFLVVCTTPLISTSLMAGHGNCGHHGGGHHHGGHGHHGHHGHHR